MRFAGMKAIAMVLGGYLVLFLTSGAFAQSLSFGGEIGWAVDGFSGPTVCVPEAPTDSCSGTWSDSEYHASGSATLIDIPGYGSLKVKAKMETVVTESNPEGYYLTTFVDAGASFNDVLTYPTLTSGSAYLSASIEITGAGSNGSGNAIAEFGTYPDYTFCQAYVSQPCAVSFQVFPGGSTPFSGILDAGGESGAGPSPGKDTSKYSYSAKITSLTLTDANGKNYEIVTASGHKYPK